MFDLGRLRLLRELAHRGTMIAVAEAYGLTSSAVSQQLAILEHEARVALLERIGRRVRLTEEGVRLVAHAEKILAAVEAAKLDLSAEPEMPRGALDVGSFPSYTRARLLPAAKRLKKRFPDFRLRIHDLQPADATDAVRSGRYQLAISFSYNLVPRAAPEGLVSRPLLQEPVFLALPKIWRDAGDPIDLRKLIDAEWIVGARQSDDRELAERACAPAGFAPKIAHTIDDYELLLHMVGGGFGVGLVPELALRFPSAKKVVMRRPGKAPLYRHIHAITRRSLMATAPIQALFAELENDA